MDTDILTVEQMTTMLSDSGRALETATAALTAAQRSYAQVTDRTRYSTDEGHAASFAERLPSLAAVEDAALHAAEVAEINARQTLRQLRELDVPALSEADATAAAARANLIAMEAARSPFALLVPAIRRALATDDKPALYLYRQALHDRVRTKPTGETPEDEADRLTVRRLLADAGDRLRSGQFDGLRTLAESTLGTAVETRTKAGRRRQEDELRDRYIRDGYIPIPDEAA